MNRDLPPIRVPQAEVRALPLILSLCLGAAMIAVLVASAQAVLR